MLEEALSLLAAVALAAREEKGLGTLHTQGLSATFGQDHRPIHLDVLAAAIIDIAERIAADALALAPGEKAGPQGLAIPPYEDFR